MCVRACARVCEVLPYKCALKQLVDSRRMLHPIAVLMKLPPSENFQWHVLRATCAQFCRLHCWQTLVNDCYARALLNNPATLCHMLLRINWTEMKRFKGPCVCAIVRVRGERSYAERKLVWKGEHWILTGIANFDWSVADVDTHTSVSCVLPGN